MNALNHLSFNQHPVAIEIDEHDQAWFRASDVCAILEYTNPREALRNHADKDDVKKIDTLTKGGLQSVNFINESGVYALAFNSHKPQARVFRRWVTAEVLPTLRRTGTYTMHEPREVREAPVNIIFMGEQRRGRGQLSSLDLLARQAPDLVEWVFDEIEAKYRPQKDISKELTEKLARRNLPPISYAVFHSHAQKIWKGTYQRPRRPRRRSKQTRH